jgi:hypothetical protein
MFIALLPQTSAAATEMFDVQANPHVWNDGLGLGGNLGLDQAST